MTTRAKILEAVKAAREAGGKLSMYRYVRQCDLDVILPAAEKWAETLPETRRVWLVSGINCLDGTPFAVQHDSKEVADEWFETWRKSGHHALAITGPFEVPK